MSRRTRLAPVTTRPRRRPVRVYSVSRQVWRAALSLAGGDATRLIIEGPGTVLVAATPQPWQARRAWARIEPGAGILPWDGKVTR